MGYNDRILTCNIGEGVYLYPTTNNIIESQKIIWKKVYYTKAEIDKEVRRSPLDRILFPKDIGGTFVDENNDKKADKAYPLVYYTFKKEDEGKYIKFYAMLNGYVHSDQGVAFYVNTPLSANVLVRKVIVNKSNFKVGEQIKLSVEYNTPYDKVPQKTKENVKWKVRVGNTDKDLVVDGSPMIGEKISFNVPWNWEGEEVLFMPFLNKHTDQISAKVVLNVHGKQYGEYKLQNKEWVKISSKGELLKLCIYHDEVKGISIIEDVNGNTIEIKNGIRHLAGEIRSKDVDWETIYDEWSEGFGPAISYFEGNHKSINQIRSHRLFKSYLNKFKDSGLQKKAYEVDWALYEVFLTTNMQAQMMGSYNLSFYKLGDKILCLANDSKSRTSFYLHLPLDNYERNEIYYDTHHKAWMINNREANTYQNYLFIVK